MIHPKSPSAKDVLDSLKDLPTSGTVAQSAENGLIYLDIDDDWVFNALTVLSGFGYIRPPFFVYPPYPVGAHIKIVTKREAEDYELFGEKGTDVSHLIGQTVDFEVVTAHVSYPRIQKYGVEARYKIRVKSPELSKIRKELTGLSRGPKNGHFVILVGLRNPDLNEEMKEEFDKHLSPEEKFGEFENQISPEEEFENKLSPHEKHEELDDEEDDDINDTDD